MKQNYRFNFFLFFIISALFILAGCADDDTRNSFVDKKMMSVAEIDNSNPLVTYLIDAEDTEWKENVEQIEKTLNYVKIPFSTKEVNEFNLNPELSSSVKVIVVQDLSRLELKAFNKILEFVANGGHIVIPRAGTDEYFGFLAGVQKGAAFETDTVARGYKFKSDFLPAMKNKVYRNRSPHFGIKGSNYSENVEVLATSISDDAYPVILKNRIGRGEVVVFNTTQSFPKEERGLLFSSLLSGLEGIPYPVANVSSIFLDDFPAPLYDIKREPVTSEMDITQANYYVNIWWEDMLKLAREEDLVYSAYVCFDYSNQTTPPFNFYEWQNSGNPEQDLSERRLNRLMRSFKDLGHEMALHGYNHASLTSEVWPSQTYMELSLEAVNKRWVAEEYGAYPVSYVPPSNIIDSTGFAALENSIPSIVYNASIYLGDFEEGGGREFGPEPYNDHFYNFPRVTSGFEMTPSSRFVLHSAYLYTGIWTHFVHPDDVFQIPGSFNSGDYELRNSEGYAWRESQDGTPGLFPRFKKYLKEIKRAYPFIRFLKVSDAARITMNWRHANFRYTETAEKIKMGSFGNDIPLEKNYWFTYVSKANSSKIENYLKNNSIKFFRTPMLEGFLYNIETKKAALELPKLKLAKSSHSVAISEEFEKYIDLEEDYVEENIPERIKALKNEITQSQSFKGQSWDLLLKYLGWEDRTSEIWPLLESKYTQPNYPKEELILFSNEVINQAGDYPDLPTRQRWMLRQIQNEPDNLKRKQEFIDYFGLEAGVRFTKIDLLEIFRSSIDPEAKNNYFVILSQEYPAEALRLAKEMQKCPENSLLAENISWVFADNGLFEDALKWSQCTNNISQPELDNWRLQTGEYDFLKEKNYPHYLQYLIEENPGMAARELINVEPCRSDLIPISTNIAYAFASQGSYRKALDWSACQKDFPIVERLQWLNALKNYSAIEKIYIDLDQEKQNSEEVRYFMADYYLGRGEIAKSWTFTSDLSHGAPKKILQEQLNKDVLYLTTAEKKQLLKDYPELFYPEVRSKIEKEIRLNHGNFIQLNSEIISDRLEPTSFRTMLNYGFNDKNLNQHIIGVSNRNAYAVNTDVDEDANADVRNIGLGYRFTSRERQQKINYTIGSEVEFNEKGKAFYHLDARASLSKDSLFSSLQLFRRPAITGPAYNLDIYQSQLNLYEELQFKKKWQAVLYIEANHYNDDDVMDVQALTNLAYDVNLSANSKLRPYTEFLGMLGNTNRPDGYPYWTIDERLYGGFGTSYEYRNKETSMIVNLDAAYFLDTFSDQFQRYRGNILWPITPFLHFKANAEFYSLKNFYSNNFSFGLKYYFKD